MELLFFRRAQQLVKMESVIDFQNGLIAIFPSFPLAWLKRNLNYSFIVSLFMILGQEEIKVAFARIHIEIRYTYSKHEFGRTCGCCSDRELFRCFLSEIVLPNDGVFIKSAHDCICKYDHEDDNYQEWADSSCISSELWFSPIAEVFGCLEHVAPQQHLFRFFDQTHH